MRKPLTKLLNLWNNILVQLLFVSVIYCTVQSKLVSRNICCCPLQLFGTWSKDKMTHSPLTFLFWNSLIFGMIAQAFDLYSHMGKRGSVMDLLRRHDQSHKLWKIRYFNELYGHVTPLRSTELMANLRGSLACGGHTLKLCCFC